MISAIVYFVSIAGFTIWFLILLPRICELPEIPINETPVRQFNRFSTADYEDQLMRNSAQLRYKGIWMWRSKDGYGCDIDPENRFDTIQDMKNFIDDCRRLDKESEPRRPIRRTR